MATEIVPGNEASITTRIRNADGTPTDLTGCDLEARVYDAIQSLTLTHEISIDGSGLVTSSDGMSLSGAATAGVIVHTISAVESAELLEGWYTWVLTITDATGKTSTVDRGQFQVAEIGPGEVARGTTLRNLIQDVAMNGRDYMNATVTTASGNMSTIIDSQNLIYDGEYFRGCDVTFTSGRNEGVTRRVTGSSFSGTLQLSPNLPYAAQVGDTFDIVNFRGVGHRRAEYKTAINSVIRRLGDNALEPMNVALKSTLSMDNPRQRVPENVVMICGVEVLSEGQWNRVRKANRPDSAGWWIDRGSMEISFSPAWADMLLGKSVRITGMKLPGQLDRESDRTLVDPEWIIESASGNLQIGNPSNAGNLAPGQYLANRADSVRAKAITIPEPNCVRIR